MIRRYFLARYVAAAAASRKMIRVTESLFIRGDKFIQDCCDLKVRRLSSPLDPSRTNRHLEEMKNNKITTQMHFIYLSSRRVGRALGGESMSPV